MKDSEVLAIIKKVRQIARREKARIVVSFICNPSKVEVDISTSDKLSMRGERLLKTLLHVKLKTKRESLTPINLMKSGSRVDKNGNKFELWLFKSVVCKVVGTKKEIRQVKKVIEPEKTILVDEEVELPVYECPKGTVMEE